MFTLVQCCSKAIDFSNSKVRSSSSAAAAMVVLGTSSSIDYLSLEIECWSGFCNDGQCHHGVVVKLELTNKILGLFFYYYVNVFPLYLAWTSELFE